MSKGDTRCVDGQLWRHDPQHDDPYLETYMGTCPECDGAGCESMRLREERHQEESREMEEHFHKHPHG